MPILYVIVGLPLVESTLVAIMTDFANSCVVSLIFAAGPFDRVNYLFILFFSAVMLFGAVAGLFFEPVIMSFLDRTGLLKHGLGYLVIAVSGIFIFRTYRSYRRQADIDAMQHVSIDGSDTDLDQEDDDEDQLLLDKQLVLQRDDYERVDDSSRLAVTTMTTTELSLRCWDWPRIRRVRFWLTVVGVWISGFLSGVTGLGAGLLFVIAFLLAYQLNEYEATASATPMMGILTGMLTVVYLSGALPNQPIRLGEIWHYIVVCVLSGIVGAVVGCILFKRLSKAAVAVNAAIAILLVIFGALSAAIPFIDP
jgi:uncharacterized membrane protein YfcA